MEIGKDIIICPFCGQITKLVWVHGQGQCMRCGSSIDDCCRGEQAENTGEEDTSNKNEICEIKPENKETDEK